MPSIRSGKTGYAWVIDSYGKFIYHPEKSFIGDTAFDARSNRAPVSHSPRSMKFSGKR